MKRSLRTKRLVLMVMFSALVFLSVLINVAVAAAAVYILTAAEVIQTVGVTRDEIQRLMLIFVLISIPVGVMIALVVSKIPLKPVRNLIEGMDQLARGNFKTRLPVDGFSTWNPATIDIADTFNKMAQQLQDTEMLREDFINNFSHEFKTPIVSIAGFARLLRREDLPREQQREYLAIIEEESLRLSYMATNVLYMTKIENQTILTDVASFNLSEQIRSCILLLESKWEKKNLELSISLREHDIQANEEMLKQVWINLLDNAIKFSPPGETVEIALLDKGNVYQVSVHNAGDPIPARQQEKIFNKFYQADESHATEGNGIGLAIAKRVVELHHGKVWVENQKHGTVFTVELPKAQ